MPSRQSKWIWNSRRNAPLIDATNHTFDFGATDTLFISKMHDNKHITRENKPNKSEAKGNSNNKRK